MVNLDAIKARAEAATPGPWKTGGDGLVWADRLGDPVSGSTEPEDAEFIAHAITDVRDLVAEVERQRYVLERVGAVLERWKPVRRYQTGHSPVANLYDGIEKAVAAR